MHKHYTENINLLYGALTKSAVKQTSHHTFLRNRNNFATETFRRNAKSRPPYGTGPVSSWVLGMTLNCLHQAIYRILALMTLAVDAP